MRTIIPGLLASLLLLGSLPLHANELELMPIAPDRVGLTVKKSPVLYFYISQATSAPVRFTLVDSRKGRRPVAEVLLPSPTQPGYVAIRLEDYHVVLEEGVQYQWVVLVDVKPGARGHYDPPVVMGTIERVDPRSIDYDDRPCDKDAVVVFAKGGLWYDAMACLNELIEANPQDPSHRRLRSELLKEVGLILPTAN